MKSYFKHYLLAISFLGIFQINAQDLNNENKYRRSSLSMVLIESENFPNKDAVISSWENYPFPDKYNKHKSVLKSINLNSVNIEKNDLTDEDQIFKFKIEKIIYENKLANELVSTWFNLSPEGKINFDLIAERGSYSASELDVQIADAQNRASAAIRDAGKELISNTFVTFTSLNFIENEPVARALRDLTKAELVKSMAGKPQFLIDAANNAADKVYEKTKEGYSLWSKTWLYQLEWNDTIFNRLQNDYKTMKGEAFRNADYLRLKFVNFQKNMSLVTFKLGETRSQEQIIDLALVRNIDNAFAKLQKENDVFKPKVPILTSKPVTAQIGKKEGLEGGEKFEVLELLFDEKSGMTVYKKVGTIKVDKKQIWDNRYNAGQAPEDEILDKDGNPIKATLFSGKAPFGALIKQIK